MCFVCFSEINSYYFLKQRKPVDLCDGDGLCFLCGLDDIYYSDELQLQRVQGFLRTSLCYLPLLQAACTFDRFLCAE
jgi:hypothetical protein